MSRRRKILLLQPSLQPPGGGNGVAAWMIEALKSDYALSVLTCWPIDLAAVNRYYGTTLAPTDFTALRLPSALLYRLLSYVPLPLDQIKTSILQWQGKQIQIGYDLVISANYAADFGRKGIQYVHFPWAYHQRPKGDLRWYHGSAAVVAAYHGLCTRLSGFSLERMRQNVTLVNSNWTGEKVRERYDAYSITLYPPVPGDFPEIHWEDKEDGFVCIGRIAPEKELDKIIDIIASVRARGHTVHLHIIGTAENPGYYRHIRRRARHNAAWLFLHEDLSRVDLARLIASHRYGIHGMTEEHFGMAVAEMVRGGCLVFVPLGGGQVEIIGNEERLLYHDGAEAAAKIVQVLRDTDLQSVLRVHLAARRQLFSTDQFMRRMQEIVRGEIENTASAAVTPVVTLAPCNSD
jgi:glycosyltransferase involved in cell wall biosynthesis